MSEEAVNEEAVSEETAETAEVQSDGSTKKKKINKLSADELKKKIQEMEEKNLSGSKYFKHLNERLKEVEN